MEPPAKRQRWGSPDGVGAAEAFAESAGLEFCADTPGSFPENSESVPDSEPDADDESYLDAESDVESDSDEELDAETEPYHTAQRYEEMLENKWLKNYNALTEFVKQNNSIPTQRSVWAWSGKQWKLGRWVNNQRRTYRLGRILANRVVLLELIPGWIWRTDQKRAKPKKVDRKWEQWLKLLHKFVAHHKHVPAGDDSWLDGPYMCKIGAWCASQQSLHSKNLLSAEQSRKLSAVPGWKWANEKAPMQSMTDEVWMKNIKVLRKYVSVYKTLPARVLVWNGHSIGRWADEQRQKYHKGRLSAEQIAALESVPLWKWQLRAKKSTSYGMYKWNEWLEILHKYVEINRQLPIQLTVWLHDNGSRWKLGRWVSNQRENYKRKLLAQNQIDALEAVDGWYWVDPKYKERLDAKKGGAVSQSWDKWYKILDEYVKINSVIPKCDSVWTDQHGESWQLGGWVVRQRLRKRRDLLEPECVAKLEAIPGWCWEWQSKWRSVRKP